MITITEALAEVKTIEKRVTKKQNFVGEHVLRQEMIKDPLAGQGGSATVLAQERQAIEDLLDRIVAIRIRVGSANAYHSVTVQGVERTVAEWLVWRREVAPKVRQFLSSLQGGIADVRDQAFKKGHAVVRVGDTGKPEDVIVHLDEKALADEIEMLETILGELDGRLSLHNATAMVEV